MDLKENLVHLGTCTKPHGIKGEFSFHLFNQETSLSQGSSILLLPKSEASSLPEGGDTFIISKIKIGNKAIVNLENITDRNQVEAMVPFEIYIERSKLPALESGEYYLYDLIGFDVINSATEVKVGLVREFSFNGAHDIIVIKQSNSEILELPMIDKFIQKIDHDNKKIWLTIPEYI